MPGQFRDRPGVPQVRFDQLANRLQAQTLLVGQVADFLVTLERQQARANISIACADSSSSAARPSANGEIMSTAIALNSGRGLQRSDEDVWILGAEQFDELIP